MSSNNKEVTSTLGNEKKPSKKVKKDIIVDKPTSNSNESSSDIKVSVLSNAFIKKEIVEVNDNNNDIDCEVLIDDVPNNEEEKEEPEQGKSFVRQFY